MKNLFEKEMEAIFLEYDSSSPILCTDKFQRF